MSEIDTPLSNLKLLNSNNWSKGGQIKIITNIIDNQDSKPICRHPLDFTVTITINVRFWILIY